MYAQQYRQPPKDYGGTAMKMPREEEAKEAAACPPEPECGPEPGRKPPDAWSDELLIAAVIMIVMSGGRDRNMLTLLALLFILL
jgi:hypothetical protein